MDPFLARAAEILETARSCVHAGGAPTGLAILIGCGGEISIVAESDWPLESLRRERGAEMAYRVAAARGRVEVEACAAGRACRLESESPAAVWRRLLSAAPAALSVQHSAFSNQPPAIAFSGEVTRAKLNADR